MNKNNFGFKLMRALLKPIFKFYYNPIIINKEAIPTKGPILLCGNHKHLYDQNLVLLSTKRVIHYMAKKEYFDGKFAWFFKFVGCIPVDRSKKDEDAVKSALDVLGNGGAIGIFPEGTRNKTKELLLPFKFGAVSMAEKTNALIVPFAIRGDYKFRSRVTIEFGSPFKIKDMNLETANNKLIEEVKSLLLKK